MSKIIIVVITLLVVVLVCISGILFYTLNTYTKAPSSISCSSKSMQNEEDDSSTYINEITIKTNKDGSIKTLQNTSKTTFKDEAVYNAVKENSQSNVDDVKFVFDDKNKIISISYEEYKMKDENDKEISVWYKTYIEGLENSDYTCK